MRLLKYSTEKIQKLSFYTVESTKDVILWIDSEGTIHYVNNAVYDLLGFRPEEVIGRKAYDLNPAEDFAFFQNNWRLLKEKKHVTFEKQQQSKNKGFIPVEASINFIVFEGVEFSCSILRDITARKNSERKLRESEAYYRSLHDNISDLVFILDVTPEGRYKFAGLNPAEEKVLGIKSEDVRGKYIEEVFPEEVINKIVANYDQCVKLGETFAYEEKVFIGEKKKFFFTRLIPLPNDTGKVFRIIGVAQDITERKKYEKEIKDALNEVEKLKNQLKDENVYLQQEIKLSHNFDEIITQSKKFKKALMQVEQVASTNATVLILGETGTGKELISRAIHGVSSRSERPLVKVNCAALHSELIESELFGHEKGAFTGAFEKKIGRFELANGGTIFLDEIGELPLDLQVKLLRVLQEGEFERLGNPNTIKVDVRVIAATNRNLRKEVEKGNFREDLYFRLNVFPINLPPLRERKEDIPILVKYFINKFSAKLGREINNVPQKTVDRLTKYNWPGNIRELENIIERSMIISTDHKLIIGDWLLPENNKPDNDEFLSLEEMERKHITEALEKTNWRVSGAEGAANILKINSQTLVSRMKKLGISRS